jgi:hypothetical protein
MVIATDGRRGQKKDLLFRKKKQKTFALFSDPPLRVSSIEAEPNRQSFLVLFFKE